MVHNSDAMSTRGDVGSNILCIRKCEERDAVFSFIFGTDAMTSFVILRAQFSVGLCLHFGRLPNRRRRRDQHADQQVSAPKKTTSSVKHARGFEFWYCWWESKKLRIINHIRHMLQATQRSLTATYVVIYNYCDHWPLMLICISMAITDRFFLDV